MRRLLTLAALLAAAPALAQTTQWTGAAGTSDWCTPGNWSSGLPTASTSFWLTGPANGRSPEIGPGCNAVAGDVTAWGPLTVSGGTFAPQSLVVSGPAYGYPAGQLTVSAGTLQTSPGYQLLIGDGTTATLSGGEIRAASLSVAAGVTVTGPLATHLRLTGPGVVTVAAPVVAEHVTVEAGTITVNSAPLRVRTLDILGGTLAGTQPVHFYGGLPVVAPGATWATDAGLCSAVALAPGQTFAVPQALAVDGDNLAACAGRLTVAGGALTVGRALTAAVTAGAGGLTITSGTASAGSLTLSGDHTGRLSGGTLTLTAAPGSAQYVFGTDTALGVIGTALRVAGGEFGGQPGTTFSSMVKETAGWLTLYNRVRVQSFTLAEGIVRDFIAYNGIDYGNGLDLVGTTLPVVTGGQFYHPPNVCFSRTLAPGEAMAAPAVGLLINELGCGGSLTVGPGATFTAVGPVDSYGAGTAPGNAGEGFGMTGGTATTGRLSLIRSHAGRLSGGTLSVGTSPGSDGSLISGGSALGVVGTALVVRGGTVADGEEATRFASLTVDAPAGTAVGLDNLGLAAPTQFTYVGGTLTGWLRVYGATLPALPALFSGRIDVRGDVAVAAGETLSLPATDLYVNPGSLGGRLTVSGGTLSARSVQSTGSAGQTAGLRISGGRIGAPGVPGSTVAFTGDHTDAGRFTGGVITASTFRADGAMDVTGTRVRLDAGTAAAGLTTAQSQAVTFGDLEVVGAGGLAMGEYFYGPYGHIVVTDTLRVETGFVIRPYSGSPYFTGCASCSVSGTPVLVMPARPAGQGAASFTWPSDFGANVLTVRGLDVDGAAFTGIRLVLDGDGFTRLRNTRIASGFFPRLVLRHPGGPLNLDGVDFAYNATDRLLLTAEDTAPADGTPLVVYVQRPTPSSAVEGTTYTEAGGADVQWAAPPTATLTFAGAEGWRMVAPSYTVQTFRDLLDARWTQGVPGSDYPDAPFANLWQYNEPVDFDTDGDGDADRDDGYVEIAGLDAGMTLGRSYYVYVFADDDFAAPGVQGGFPKTVQQTALLPDEIATGPFTFPVVTFTDTPQPLAADGWNMAGNPFMAAMDWNAAGWTRQNVDDVLYVWDPNRTIDGVASPAYRSWNGTTGSLGSGVLTPNQGFWVKATAAAPQLVAPQAAVDTGGTPIGRGTGDADARPAVVALRLAGRVDETPVADDAFVQLDGRAALGHDPLDAYELPGAATTYARLFATDADGDALDIVARPGPDGGAIEVPLHAWAVADTTQAAASLTLSWPVLRDVPEAWRLTLVDRETGARVDLRRDSSYAFTTAPPAGLVATAAVPAMRRMAPPAPQPLASGTDAFAATAARFALRIEGAAVAGTDAPAPIALAVAAWPNPARGGAAHVRLSLPEAGVARVAVYDALGRAVATLADGDRPAGVHDLTLDTARLASGVYVVRAEAGESVVSQRLTIVR